MSNVNVRPTDRSPLLATIDPDVYSAGTYMSDWVSMADVDSIIATVMVGDELTTSPDPTVNAKLQQATDSAGAGAKDITGKAITQLSGGDGDKQVEINCFAHELDIANSFTHVRLSVTTGVSNISLAAVIRGFDARYQPLADLASVDEIIG